MAKFGTETFWGKCAEDLPLLEILPLCNEVFASYTGPDCGICYLTQNGEKNGNVSLSKCECAGVKNWNTKDQKSYGICISLYEQHPINGKMSGDPIADAFALCTRKNNSLMLIADGVNWGEKSRLAARCALNGSMNYINKKVFTDKIQPSNTQEVIKLLRKSFDEGHRCILSNEGGLTTMCVCMVCPVKNSEHFAVCCVNVGDSYAYILSHKYGIRELTVGSHDISSERDIRDAGGALGPVNGKNPELRNLTCSVSFVTAGDIVFLTTDGISDNFDPVITKVALPQKIDEENSNCGSLTEYKPEMNPKERHLYAMKEMERVINEYELVTEEPCSAQELCGALVQHVLALTDAKRKVLENPALYVRRKMTQKERDKRDSEIVQQMAKSAGKLDHASIVANEIGIVSPEEDEAMETISLKTTDSFSSGGTSPLSPGECPVSPTKSKKSRPKKLFARIRSLSVNHNSPSPSTASPSSLFPSPKKFSFKRSRSGSEPGTPISPSSVPSQSGFYGEVVSPEEVNPVYPVSPSSPRRYHFYNHRRYSKPQSQEHTPPNSISYETAV